MPIYSRSLLIHQGKNAEAETLLQEVLAIQEQTFGKDHPNVATALDAMGNLERARGDLTKAETHAARAVAIYQAAYGDSNHQTAVAKAHLAQVFIRKGQYERAEPVLREVVKAMTERELPGNLAVGAAQALLGEVLLHERNYREAEEHLTAGYKILAEHPDGPYVKRVQEMRGELATVYKALQQPENEAKFRTALVSNEQTRKEAGKR